MTIKDKAERLAVGAALDGILKYIDKRPKENLLRLIDITEKLLAGTFPKKNFVKARKAVEGSAKEEFEMLAYHLDRLFQDFAYAKELGIAGKAAMQELHESAKIYQKTIEIYRQVLKKSL